VRKESGFERGRKRSPSEAAAGVYPPEARKVYDVRGIVLDFPAGKARSEKNPLRGLEKMRETTSDQGKEEVREQGVGEVFPRRGGERPEKIFNEIL